MSRPIEFAVSGIQAPSSEERSDAIVAAPAGLANPAMAIGSPIERPEGQGIRPQGRAAGIHRLHRTVRFGSVIYTYGDRGETVFAKAA
jgi:hypothetical protein